MNFLKKIMLIFFLLCFQSLSYGMENAFYVLRGVASEKTSNSLANIANHSHAVNIIISQAYHINKSGVVSGRLDPSLVNFSRNHSIKLMAMITNSNFDKDITHYFLSHSAAQKKALKSILEICHYYHLHGVQFDFEMMSFKDRKALTKFYQMVSATLHAHGFAVSFVVAPAISDGPLNSPYQKKLYQNYVGVYDLKELSKLADFITIMAYDQHIGRITPGPTASMPWVDAVIKHALKYMPPQKISLGIPSYSTFWYTGVNYSDPTKKITLQNNAIGYATAVSILKKNHARVQWDDTNHLHYSIYERNWLNEYIFVEDAHSFKTKFNLAKQYNLRGISFFRVGTEDPRIWNELG